MAVASMNVIDIAERRVGERRVGAPRVKMADVVNGMAPLQERRAAHRFQGTDGPHDGFVAGVSCASCGYVEAGHLALTEPEQEVVTALLNQREAPPLMRRSILRKLTSRLRIAR